MELVLRDLLIVFPCDIPTRDIWRSHIEMRSDRITDLCGEELA